MAHFVTYQEAVNFLAREIDIAGGFKNYDQNNNGRISAQEFQSQFRLEAPRISGRYFDENTGEPTFVYRNTMQAAEIVFSDGRNINQTQSFEATDPKTVGRKLGESIRPYVEDVQKWGSEAGTFAKGMAPIAGDLLKGLREGATPRGSVKSSRDAIAKIDANGDGFITRAEAYAQAKKLADQQYPEIPDTERKKTVTTYVNAIFGKDSKLKIDEYQKRFDAVDEAKLQSQAKSLDGANTGVAAAKPVNPLSDLPKQSSNALAV